MKNLLIFEKNVKSGVVYSHHWGTGNQLLLFPDHATARAIATEKNWDFKGA
jgi:hypothetical protein